MKYFIIAFLLISNFAISQSKIARLEFDTNDRHVVRRYLDYPLTFKLPLDGDQWINVGVVSDSIDVNVITLSLFVYYPPIINPGKCFITITYFDRTKDILFPINKSNVDNYIEYDFTGQKFSIHKKPVKEIEFTNISTYSVENPKYFIEFINEIIKK
jgi:hypothetical protein